MPLNYQRLKDWKFSDRRYSYTAQKTILYALGIGFGEDPLNPTHLQYLLEDRLVAFPTFAMVLGGDSDWMSDPDIRITYSHIVHGEQVLRVHAPLPGEGTVIVRTVVDEIVDKGKEKGAIVYMKRTVHREADDGLIAAATSGIFCRADGGFDGPVTRGPEPHAMPLGSPEATLDLPTSPRAALIYRLSGDLNPLHADPAAAKVAGFPKPILHGMCTYAMAARAIIQHFGQGDPGVLKSLQVRFVSPVFPGETLRSEYWRTGDVVSFRMRVVERDTVVLNNGRAELNA